MLKSLFIIFLTLGLHASSLSAQSIWTMDPLEVRHLINQRIMDIEAEQPEVHDVIDIQVLSRDRQTPVRIYFPNASGPLPLLLLIHGGGWVAGNLDTHDNMARYLCREAQVVVVSVGYNNSPESKFPEPLEQCYDVLLWAFEHSQQLHANSSQLAVVGDSAGGNMTAALCLLARDRKGPIIGLQLLINPSPDLTCSGTLEEQGDSTDILRWFTTQYVTNLDDVTNPYVSPLIANDLSKLPPAVIILAEHDELREDGQLYADKLCAARVSAYTYIQRGIGHLGGNGARASKQAKESLDAAVVGLRSFLQKNPS